MTEELFRPTFVPDKFREAGGKYVKAFVKTGSQPGDAGVADVPVAEPGPGEALLRVASCGSDLPAYRSDPGFEWVRTPVTLGHEFSGTVEAIGKGQTVKAMLVP